MPTYALTRPPATLAIAYPAPSASWPSFTSTTDSTARVENVVKEPRNPTAKNGRSSRPGRSRSMTNVMKNPSTSAPERFVRKVGHGKLDGPGTTTRETP